MLRKYRRMGEELHRPESEKASLTQTLHHQVLLQLGSHSDLLAHINT